MDFQRIFFSLKTYITFGQKKQVDYSLSKRTQEEKY
jgi:hypothetical protein